ncbi:MAG TPA: choice-of-anchor tandem repeat GloVer-containing protein [Terriglobia bacterium]
MVVAAILTMLAASAAPAQTYTVLYTFTGNADGAVPVAGLIADSSGDLYGTTLEGGPYGSGVVFKLDPAGHQTVLDNFTRGKGGAYPSGGLVRDGAGNLYGTTTYGGLFDDGFCSPMGCGVIFKIGSPGFKTVLYNLFPSSGGANPMAGLIRDAQGNLYGTTAIGGNYAGPCNVVGSGCGVVFKLDPAGSETELYRFAGSPDGAAPAAGLIQDAAGNLYGTTALGGHRTGPCSPYGCGVVFRVDSSGHETVLYRFGGGADGASPQSGLVQDAAGNLYGTTYEAGAFGYGVVFKLDLSGNETVLHSFSGGSDGRYALAGLVQDASGNLYGTTANGGDLNACDGVGCGVLFKLDSAGNETVLQTFTGGTDGASPRAPLLAEGGFLFGTASGGGDAGGACGDSGCGVVFRLSIL